MKVIGWLRQPERRAQLPGWLLLAAAAAWGLFRTIRSVRMLLDISHDLNIYYSLWFLLGHREYADIALSQALYLPHTWAVLTPLFLLGWPGARLAMLLINVACAFYIWHRLSELAELKGLRRWLMLAFFWDWLCTGLVVGLGNLALVCVAAALAAYPFSTITNSFYLTLAAMKQSLVFPLYLRVLFQRPQILILPLLVIGACGLGILWWARLGPADVLTMARGSLNTVQGWTQYDLTSLRRLLSPVLGNGAALSAVVWGIWFGLYATVIWLVKEPLAQLAALLLLSLLPIYHQEYDLVAAAPMLALLLRRGPLVWPGLMTLLLAVNPASAPLQMLPAGIVRKLAEGCVAIYNPVLVLGLLGVLLCRERAAVPGAPGSAALPAERK